MRNRGTLLRSNIKLSLFVKISQQRSAPEHDEKGEPQALQLPYRRLSQSVIRSSTSRPSATDRRPSRSLTWPLPPRSVRRHWYRIHSPRPHRVSRPRPRDIRDTSSRRASNAASYPAYARHARGYRPRYSHPRRRLRPSNACSRRPDPCGAPCRRASSRRGAAGSYSPRAWPCRRQTTHASCR